MAESKAARSKAAFPKYTVPSMSLEQGSEVARELQGRLDALNDLALTLKHVHWNVVGPHFIAVHEMLDPQVDGVRARVDAVAERIATLGVAPVGTPGALVKARSWDDYSIGRADAISHLGALDLVYQGVISDHREAAEAVEESDPVTNDLLIGQLADLELYHWFIRAHLESSAGALSTNGAGSETTAAQRADAAAN
jgi:starvation-inducible DNA-binding protein